MNIYPYLEEQETAFKNPIPLESGWNWNFKEHIRLSFLYKNSQFSKDNEKRELRPNKNIIRPILNIHYRTEGFDVKDIELYVDNPDTYYKSFLIKKYHDRWALKNQIDTFIDELVESFVDYGGVLVKNVRGVRPEVVDLRTLAFCDQTDMLGGPFAIKHYYSPSQLREMTKYGWEEDKIDYLIMMAEAHKNSADGDKIKTTGKYIELYEVQNICEGDYSTYGDSTKKMMIVGKYKDENEQTHGVTVFEKEVPDIGKVFKFLKRDPIQGRVVGFGGVEELFEPQVWTNFAEIHMAGMLQQLSKVLYKSNDPKFKGQNLVNKDNGDVLTISDGKDITQLDTQARSLNLFTNYGVQMHEHAMEMGAASDLFLGQQPTSGTPFKSLETQLVQGKSLHIWRQGRIAAFVDTIYRDWILPQLSKEILKGDKFMATLSSDELLTIARRIKINKANKRVKEAILSGRTPRQEEYELIKQTIEQEELDKGDKRFLEILKDEMSGENLQVFTNIAGKQKDLALLTDKLVNYLRQLIATPDIRQNPEMLKHINEILEYSGLSPIRYNQPQPTVPQEGSASTQGLKELSQANLSDKEKVTV